MFAAGVNGHDLGNVCRLAQTCLYNEVQSHTAISLRTVYGRSLSRLIDGQCLWTTRPEGLLSLVYQARNVTDEPSSMILAYLC